MQIKMRKGIYVFKESSTQSELLIVSIDPMFISNLKAFINQDSTLQIKQMQTVLLSEVRTLWHKQGYVPEEQNLDGIEEGCLVVLQKIPMLQ